MGSSWTYSTLFLKIISYKDYTALEKSFGSLFWKDKSYFYLQWHLHRYCYTDTGASYVESFLWKLLVKTSCVLTQPATPYLIWWDWTQLPLSLDFLQYPLVKAAWPWWGWFQFSCRGLGRQRQLYLHKTVLPQKYMSWFFFLIKKKKWHFILWFYANSFEKLTETRKRIVFFSDLEIKGCRQEQLLVGTRL